ncbi:restriction system protein [Kitasatospora herbaricolor]|uniref:restriction endonuclease n=1 Tax=Kitasatospora herbaricolor TaxID=68217 RepID=UPI00174C3931|nr:restriction endonuclease [Kitasatospora herbaricolor]MDQ0308427.1 restriction system protein [Kitasatospora herbaricolor]
MQYTPDGRHPSDGPAVAEGMPGGGSDGTATALQPGFLASVFRDLGAAPGPGEPGQDADGGRAAGRPEEDVDEAVAAHGRAAALTHHRTLTVRAEHDRLADLLRRAALPVSPMDFESQLRTYEPRPFPAGEAGPDGTGPEPRWEDYVPPRAADADPDEGPSRRLLDSGYQRELAQARLTHQRALREWRTRRAEAADSGEAESRRAHQEAEQARARAVREYNDSLEECRRAYRLAEPAAVESLIERALAASETATQDLPAPCRAVFRPLTSTAVLDLDLPPLDLVPSLTGYRLTPEGEIEPVPRPAPDRATDYLRLVARLALRALQAADAVDTDEILAGVVLNGWLREPGSPEAVCLVSVDADRDALARTRLLPAGAPYEEGQDGDGVYADAERDEALVRLRQLGAAVTPDPYARAGVEPAAAAGATVPSAADLSANEFAELVRELLTRGGLDGWSVRLRGPAGLVATGEGEAGSALPGRWVVWASRAAAPVAEEEIRTLAEAVREEAADRGLRLTTGRFSDAALDLTGDESHQHIHLVDGDGVRELARTHLGLPLGAGV